MRRVLIRRLVGCVVIVGARRRRAEVGSRVKLNVVVYAVDLDQGLWAFTVCDARQTPIVRSSSNSDEIGRTFTKMCSELDLLLDVQLVRVRNRLVRDDERWDVAVRSLTEPRDELPFRVS